MSGRQAGAEPPSALAEAEITEAMLAAGEHMLVEEIGICGADIASDIAADVFRAMWAARIR